VFENIRMQVNIATVILQLVGFGIVIVLLATTTIKSRGGGFTSDFSDTPNVMSIIKNPQEHECKAMEAMQIALEANVQLCNMLKTIKQQYGSVDKFSEESDFDYGC
jgi:hypothetical protein